MNRWINKIPPLKWVYSYFKRPTEIPETTVLAIKQQESVTSKRFPLAIYESELQMIGFDSASWDTETGGDLFGVWQDIPIIYLATLAGPKAIRNHAHFRLDLEYLIALSADLEVDWGLRYFGDWHSHHSLGLASPSSGDKKRIVSVAKKNNFEAMAEFIITFTPTSGAEKQIAIHPFAYLNPPSTSLTDVGLIVLKGTSPVRSMLMAASMLPEQKLGNYANFTTNRLTIPIATAQNKQPNPEAYKQHIGGRLISSLVDHLATLTTRDIELHEQPFGSIIVIPVNNFENIALAVGNEWPHPVLQADWINRQNGSVETLQIDIKDLDALNIDRVKQAVIDIKKTRD